MCSPVLVLPDAATADVDELRVSAGRVRDDTAHHRERGSPHITVRGRHSFGEVTLRHPRKPRWRGVRSRVARRRTTPDPRHAGS
jgi:hypothetical protein